MKYNSMTTKLPSNLVFDLGIYTPVDITMHRLKAIFSLKFIFHPFSLQVTQKSIHVHCIFRSSKYLGKYFIYLTRIVMQMDEL